MRRAKPGTLRALVLGVVVLAACQAFALRADAKASLGEGTGSADGWETSTGARREDDGVGGTGGLAMPSGDADHEGTSSYTSDDVPTAAETLVRHYRDDECCFVLNAGYLDLSGRVWGCVLEGPGWVDVCTVSEHPNGRGSVIRTVRHEADGKGSQGDVEED